MFLKFLILILYPQGIPVEAKESSLIIESRFTDLDLEVIATNLSISSFQLLFLLLCCIMFYLP
jgi:hypothetical protein